MVALTERPAALRSARHASSVDGDLILGHGAHRFLVCLASSVAQSGLRRQPEARAAGWIITERIANRLGGLGALR